MLEATALRSWRCRIGAFVLFAVASAASTVCAEHLADSERVEFLTEGGGEKISGFYFQPSGLATDAKAPGVVLVHGSGGVNNVREGFWGRELASAGVAVLAIDSFTPRGITSTVADQSRVTTAQMIRDAFGALAYLASQPVVDATRIAVMGMSRGGGVALQAADERAAPQARTRFAGHIPVYPGCTTQYRTPRMRSPMLMLIGANDDYTGVKSCASYVERIRAAGGNVMLKLYEGAQHDFDTAGQQSMWLPRAQNFRDCIIYIEDDGRATLADTGELIPLDDPRTGIAILKRTCMRMGATIAYSAEARTRALEDVKAFIKTQMNK